MPGRLVWIVDTTTAPYGLTCGHTTADNGRPTATTHQPPRVGDAWECDRCAGYIAAQLARLRAQRAARRGPESSGAL